MDQTFNHRNHLATVHNAFKAVLEDVGLLPLAFITFTLYLEDGRCQGKLLGADGELFAPFETIIAKVRERELSTFEGLIELQELEDLQKTGFRFAHWRNFGSYCEALVWHYDSPFARTVQPFPAFFIESLATGLFTYSGACRVALLSQTNIMDASEVSEFHEVGLREACRRLGPYLGAPPSLLPIFKQKPGGASTRESLYEHILALAYKPEEGRYLSDVALIPNHDLLGTDFVIKMRDPIPFSDHLADRKLARKTLDIATAEDAVVVQYNVQDGYRILGLARPQGKGGKTKSSLNEYLATLKVLSIHFTGRGAWQIRNQGNTILNVQDGRAVFTKEVKLPAFSAEILTPKKASKLGALCKKILEKNKGAILIVTSEAEDEAERLAGRGTPIQPLPFEQAQHVIPAMCRIDGAVILDLDLVCHAYGVILDGVYTPGSGGTPKGKASRGSRYNSALSYVQTRGRKAGVTAFAVVYSSDGGMDVVTPEAYNTKAPVQLAPLGPTWLSRSSLSLWDDEERQDWDFELLVLPDSALTETEKALVYREFKARMTENPDDRWNENGIFRPGHETLIAIKASSKAIRMRTQITRKNLLGFVSFQRYSQWSDDIWADGPEEDFERNVLHLHYEPYQIYVKPEHRGKKLGHALMHALGQVFSDDLRCCVIARPVKLQCSYMGQYYSPLGERVGNYCVGEFEMAIDLARDLWGWLTPVEDLEVDGGL